MAQRGAAIPVLNDKTKLSPVVKRRDNFLEEGGRRRNKQQRKKGCVRTGPSCLEYLPQRYLGGEL